MVCFKCKKEKNTFATFNDKSESDNILLLFCDICTDCSVSVPRLISVRVSNIKRRISTIKEDVL